MVNTTDNIEALVIAWLATVVPSEYLIYADRPTKVPSTYILVDRTGGPREAMVLDRASILVEVYDKDSRLNASNVANVIADSIPELLAYDEDITHAAVNSVVSLDALVTQYHRYQVYCDIYFRR